MFSPNLDIIRPKYTICLIREQDFYGLIPERPLLSGLFSGIVRAERMRTLDIIWGSSAAGLEDQPEDKKEETLLGAMGLIINR